MRRRDEELQGCVWERRKPSFLHLGLQQVCGYLEIAASSRDLANCVSAIICLDFLLATLIPGMQARECIRITTYLYGRAKFYPRRSRKPVAGSGVPAAHGYRRQK